MMLPSSKDRDKVATIILNIGQPSSMSSSDYTEEESMDLFGMAKALKSGAEQDSSMGLEAAVDEMMMALEQKDRASFLASLKSFVEMVVL